MVKMYKTNLTIYYKITWIVGAFDAYNGGLFFPFAYNGRHKSSKYQKTRETNNDPKNSKNILYDY